MAQIVVRNLEDDVMQGLKALAGRRGVSAEQAVRSLIAEAVESERRLAAFRTQSAAARQRIEKTRGTLSDSAADIRADRWR
jgi:plasmid stability protein